MSIRGSIIKAGLLSLVLILTTSGGILRKKKYENPITKDTQQPDKVLFDKAIHDIEKGRFEVARLTLNTLINTYDTSEFLAKSKLAIADSEKIAGQEQLKDTILHFVVGWCTLTIVYLIHTKILCRSQ